MNDEAYVIDARARERRAREREARALAHAQTATYMAEQAPTPEAAEAFRREAATHRRAAQLHHRAIAIQARHAEAHEPPRAHL